MQVISNSRCLVTGATSGLGFETALLLLRSGASVVIHGRSVEKAAEAVKRLTAAAPDAKCEAVDADLGDVTGVDKLAAAAQGEFDLVINNAGAAFPEFATNEKGIERTVWINHFTPLILTRALLPRVAKDGVIATVSSMSAGYVQIDPDAPDVTGKNLKEDYSQLRAYGTSKLLNLVAMNALARRVGGEPMIILTDPGGIQTDFARKAGEKAFLDMTLEHWDDCVSAEEAARQVLQAVRRKDLETGARYYEGKKAEMFESAHDERFADKVLTESEKVIGHF